ncbi:hypothetical protein E1293_13155 [Actinomadura darangshiensis]|uniref:DUF6777 domain-containing protein n=1 Tax=Actinomadura darangshiensis TaxID=705336 RepID=A0A4R5BF62_9ACTN|nr:DUF6777 domain-containing protein [Actinomadura darangshiensis]TDD84265.1 hypothetical protein E1293_13155 [Actinomadura darangshiensis]
MLKIRSTIARYRACAVPLAGSAAALAVAAGTLSGCGDAGATITRLTVGSPGPEPYTLVADTDKANVKERPRAGGTKDGDSPGLYGGTRRASTCDRRKLVAFLQANPDKARAWAGVQGIPVSDIPRYVSRLTPVLLRTDTLVTNHGYRDGKATSGPAVLQAGMGVLINGYGVPAVKCNCGNPLTRPEKKISTRNASYDGRSWPGFEKANVTRIRPRDSRKGTITTFVLVDPEGTMGFERPRATGGPEDGPPTGLPSTETEVPSSDSPSPSDSGLESPGTESPGTESPGLETPGTESPGTPGPETPDPQLSPASPGVTPQERGRGTGGMRPGDGPPSPISLPPSEEPAPAVT